MVTAVVRTPRRDVRNIYDHGLVELLRDPGIADLAAQIEKLPEELREALRSAVSRAGDPPEKRRRLRLAQWCQRVLRRAMDEVDKLFED